MSTSGESLQLRVQAIRWEADGVCSVELRDPAGRELPSFDAGSHIDLALPGGLSRSYSLSNAPSERHRYVVAVNRDAASRGGSLYVHDQLRVGDLLPCSRPRNNFMLNETASNTVLIAGGIGITPMMAMIHRLDTLGRAWTLWFAVRTRNAAPFLRELQELASRGRGSVLLHVDDEAGAVLDLVAVVRTSPADAEFYCCGPLPMLTAFEAVDVAASRRHVEYFSTTQEASTAGGFEVELAQSQTTVRVEPGQTILAAVEAAGVDVPFSCTEGICGTCETKVLMGIPEHRDMVLTDNEKETNEVMMICVSGSLSPRLVLDR